MNLQKVIQANYSPETVVSRWVLINNQETCHWELVKLIDGWWKNSEDAKEAYLEQTKSENIFRENLFSVRSIEFCKSYWETVKPVERYRYKENKEFKSYGYDDWDGGIMSHHYRNSD